MSAADPSTGRAPTPDRAVNSEVTVAIPNYNGRELLEALLRSIGHQTLTPAAVVVVDDCSEDDSLDYLRINWPHVRVLAQPVRRGVTAAMNACLAAAESELVALFNNDVELEPDCLAELAAELARHPEAGSVTPKMLDFTERGVLDGAGDLLNWRGGGRRRGHGDPDTGQYEQAEEVFGPCGGAAVYRRSALEAVGGFDEAYYAYYEDIDWAFRAQLAGIRCRYVPTAVLHHHGSATLGRGFSDFNGYHLWRNPVWLVAKCYPAGALIRHGHQIARGQLGNLFVAVRERRLGVWARAMRDALHGMPRVLRQRRALQRARAISAAELEQRAKLGRR